MKIKESIEAMKKILILPICLSLIGTSVYACKKENPAPVITITTHPASPSAFTEGDIPANVRLTVAAIATGGAKVEYQWYGNTTQSTAGATSVTGATEATYTIPTDLTAGSYHYFCEVSAKDATSKRSNFATVTVKKREEVEQDVYKKYYVSNDGSGMGNGSISKPFKSINTALGVANPGDTVFVRGGTYREKVVFPKSGTDDKRIVLKAYRNEKPLITGEGMNLTESYINVVHISGMSNITMEGFEVANFIAPDGVIEINGITVDAGASNVTLRGNHIHHIQNFNPYPGGGLCGGHAILIIGNNNRKMQNIVVESNKIHDCVTGYSETVTVNGYVDGFTVDGNEIYHCSNIGIDAAGGYAANAIPAYNYARNGVISGNVLYDISSVHGLVYERIGLGSIAIYADGSRNITIERNRIFGCDRGIGIVSETNNYPTTGCIVRNNIVYDCHLTGIYTGGYLGYTGGGSDNCYIVNNTLYGNNRATGPYANEIEGEIRFTENCRDNVVANNLICASSSTDLFVHKYTSTGSGNVFENNHYSGPGKWMWGYLKSNAISDFGVWKNTVGGDADGFYTSTPFFNFTPSPASDFGIGSDPTVKNAGKVYSTEIVGTLDFAGNPRTVDAKISIGALQ